MIEARDTSALVRRSTLRKNRLAKQPNQETTREGFRVKIWLFSIFIAASLLGLRLFKNPLLSDLSYSRAVYAQDNQLLRLTLSEDEKYRLPTDLNLVDAKLVEAFLLHEDQLFFFHPGVNPYSLARALFAVFLPQAKKVGGSTITMQLARLKYDLYTKNYLGKMQQIALAIWLEALYSKKEILKSYLTLAPFGGNIEGIEAASLIYYQKSAQHLSLAEALTLAIIPQSPRLRSLNQDDATHLVLLRSRQELFRSWVQRHPKDQQLQIDLELPLTSQKIRNLPFYAPHFVETVLRRQASELSPTHIGSTGKTAIKTNLNLRLQLALEKNLKAYLISKNQVGAHNGAMMVVNYETLNIEALIGSNDYQDRIIEGQVNGTIAKRSPGSTLKPLLYALALDQGLITPMTLLKDTPKSFGAFEPENFDQNFSGPISATDALIHSRNVPAVTLDSQIKSPSFHDFLSEFGISDLKTQKHYGLSLSLGGAEVTMEELVSLYALLANLGERKKINWFESAKTTPLHKEKFNLLSKEAAFIALDMLTKNPRPSGERYDEYLKNPTKVAWKTGTSFGFRDAWSVGIFGQYVVAVWIGNFDSTPNPAFVGRDMAGPLLFQVIDHLKPLAKANPRWQSPLGLNVKKVNVCALSGAQPNTHCRHQVATWFIPTKSPIADCKIHQEIWISKVSKKRLCYPPQNPLLAQTEVFEIWPTDLLRDFKAFGVVKRTPPEFEASCALSLHEGRGSPPQITSPRAGLAYKIRVSNKLQNKIPLQAVIDSDASEITWFIDSELVGKSDRLHPILWTARPGHFTVRAVDNLGRTDSREVQIQMIQ